jgi:hypothetical protein
LECLFEVAAQAHEGTNWMGGPSVVISNGDPAEPLGPGTEMNCLLLLAEDPEFGVAPMPDGRKVVFYAVYPIYAEERDYEKTKGVRALINRFEKRGVSPVLDPKRAVAVKR